MTIGMFLVGLAAGGLTSRFGSRNLLIGGAVISAVTLLAMAIIHSSEMVVYVTVSILGIGFGLAFSAMSTLIVAAVDPGQTGVASGMNANVRTIGGSLGTALMASIVTSGSPTLGGFPKESGYARGFLMLSVAVCLAAIVALFLPSDRSADRSPKSDARAPMPDKMTGAVDGKMSVC
ncbi:MFS transporter [Nocardia pseudovaccinii]|uniref:MFS transporter n=1 Tax=Nocardia pseudovaccinii TaxID=189540 RepID=UPI003D915E65